jgi:hypothetical protein
MWKRLNSGDNVCVGDKVRFIRAVPGDWQDAYTVIKTEQHYFQVVPGTEKSFDDSSFRAKIVKYFEIGHNMMLEIWQDH